MREYCPRCEKYVNAYPSEVRLAGIQTVRNEYCEECYQFLRAYLVDIKEKDSDNELPKV